MRSIRNFAYAALLAVTAFSTAPTLAQADDAARGRFTLTHDVHWGNTMIPAGEYEFSFAPDTVVRFLRIDKLNGAPESFMLLVNSTEMSKPSDSNQLLLETRPQGSYVSAMQLPKSGMTLFFAMPSRPTERQIAKAATSASASGQ